MFTVVSSPSRTQLAACGRFLVSSVPLSDVGRAIGHFRGLKRRHKFTPQFNPDGATVRRATITERPNGPEADLNHLQMKVL